jgi:glutamate--cysteine ligase catalytic subunit
VASSCEQGDDSSFPGLLGLVDAYVNQLQLDISSRCQIKKYLDLVKNRANGTLMTPANWYRQFIRNHPAYKQDSVVNSEICYDLARAVDEMYVLELCPFLLVSLSEQKR